MARIGDIFANWARGDRLNHAEIESVRREMNMIQAQSRRSADLADKIDPQSGDISVLKAGNTVLGPGGLTLYQRKVDSADEDAQLKIIDSRSGGTVGTIGGYKNSAANTHWLNIYANANQDLDAFAANGIIEIAAKSTGATHNWGSFLTQYAYGDSTSADTVMNYVVGKTGAWITPIDVIHDWGTRETVIVLAVKKTTTGDPPAPEEGMLYYNTFDNAIKMYADGAWRTLASW